MIRRIMAWASVFVAAMIVVVGGLAANPLPGEEVPESFARTLRGGVCYYKIKFDCENVDMQYCNQAGSCSDTTDCKAKTNLYEFVKDYDVNNTEQATDTKYCCGAGGICNSYYSNYKGCVKTSN